jgi:hypothetical protein
MSVERSPSQRSIAGDAIIDMIASGMMTAQRRADH